tara:strand:+ start:109 stop:396 length:288 start_codon:yes stop_codon:yes gene_type:complete
MDTLDINARCLTCNGSGVIKTPIALDNLVELVEPFHALKGTDSKAKIEAIKAVRDLPTEDGAQIGLKTAKELVEQVFYFLDNLAVVVKNNNGTKD